MFFWPAERVRDPAFEGHHHRNGCAGPLRGRNLIPGATEFVFADVASAASDMSFSEVGAADTDSADIGKTKTGAADRGSADSNSDRDNSNGSRAREWNHYLAWLWGSVHCFREPSIRSGPVIGLSSRMTR